jgi:hypothetical protein
MPALDPVPALNDPSITDEDRDFLLALGHAQDWPATSFSVEELSRMATPHLRAILEARFNLVRAHLDLILCEKESDK